MRIVAVEEHFTFPDLLGRIDLATLDRNGGECLPTMMDRVERVFSSYSRTHLDRNAARAIVEQVWVSTSGFSSTAAFLAAFMTFGADRILFSVDYPFGNNSAAVACLENLPVSPEDRQKIAHQNADALLRLMPRRAHRSSARLP